MNPITVSQRGESLIKDHEGLRLDAYPDPGTGGKPFTIGYGHTRGVKLGDRITEAEAEQFLRDDLQWVEACVNEAVTVPLSQNQFDALCSFVFNVGGPAFRQSTMLRLLNVGNYHDAARQFDRWNKAGGCVMVGLTKRRKAERLLFERSAPCIET